MTRAMTCHRLPGDIPADIAQQKRVMLLQEKEKRKVKSSAVSQECLTISSKGRERECSTVVLVFNNGLSIIFENTFSSNVSAMAPYVSSALLYLTHGDGIKLELSGFSFTIHHRRRHRHRRPRRRFYLRPGRVTRHAKTRQGSVSLLFIRLTHLADPSLLLMNP